jgi:hypothetical protein
MSIWQASAFSHLWFLRRSRSGKFFNQNARSLNVLLKGIVNMAGLGVSAIATSARDAHSGISVVSQPPRAYRDVTIRSTLNCATSRRKR